MIAKVTDVSAAHVSNVKNGRAGVGKDFEAAIARYWGMGVEELRRVAAAQYAPEETAKQQPAIRRLRDRDDWEDALAQARQFYRTLSEEELAAVGECYDHTDYPVTAEFVGLMAQALRARRDQSRHRGNPEPGSGPTRKGARAG